MVQHKYTRNYLVVEESGGGKEGEFGAVRGVEEDVATGERAKRHVKLLQVEQRTAHVAHPAQYVQGRRYSEGV